jgi:hypothetical protein
MNVEDYFSDLSKELRAVQNRLRNLIGLAHLPSDGAWKESVLRTVVRRYLPPSYSVGSGFVVTTEGVSTQIDLMVCDDSAPILFRDGDLLISPADCVRAVVEVKTNLNSTELTKSLKKLNEISTLMRRRCLLHRPFFGLFCYGSVEMDLTSILDSLQQTNGGIGNYEMQAVCCGDRQFIRFWQFDPRSNSHRPYDSWHAYNLPETAPGYFVHNFVEYLFPHAVERAENLWYPPGGKEPYLVATRSRRQATPVASGQGGAGPNSQASSNSP